MLKNDWSKKLKKMFSNKGADPLKIEITPYRDWMVLVIIFFVGLIASFGFNIFMSVKINSDNFFTVAPVSEGSASLNKNGLAKILAEFTEKEKLFEKIRTEGVPVVDPSL